MRRVALQIVVVGLGISLAGAASAQSSPGVVNRLAPEVQWNALLELGNGAGLRVNAHGFVPRLPLYGGLVAGTFWGSEPFHVAGDRTPFLPLTFMAHDEVELRAGLVLAGWRYRPVKVEAFRATGGYATATGTVTTGVLSTSTPTAPTFHATAVYAGLRYVAPDVERCDTAPGVSLAEDCADLSPVTLVLGLYLLDGHDFDAHTGQGVFRQHRHTAWDVRLLYTPEDAWRPGLRNQLGAEVRWTLGVEGFTGHVALGWDGDVLLASIAGGWGGITSVLTRPVVNP